MVTRAAAIAGIGTAFPREVAQSDLWEQFFKAHYSDNPLARRFFSSAGVSTRHAAVVPMLEDTSTWTTEQRMTRYVTEAHSLGLRAVNQALEAAGTSAKDVGQLIVVSCTGYSTPGIDSMIAAESGMSTTVQRLLIGHMGCHAALPAIETAADFVTVQQQPAVVVCVELASIHLQQPTSDTGQMVVHSLFGDGASAAVIEPATRTSASLEFIDALSITDVNAADLMTWRITDHGFRMQLSQRVPDVLAAHIEPAVEALLTRHSLALADIKHWAAHPGGPRILDVIGNQLGLKPDRLTHSRDTLSQHGNCSSATVLMVVDAINRCDPPLPGDYMVALAFGPGLTLYCALLRQQ
jgi:alkylresorcinol/alkylpyrone synthase